MSSSLWYSSLVAISALAAVPWNPTATTSLPTNPLLVTAFVPQPNYHKQDKRQNDDTRLNYVDDDDTSGMEGMMHLTGIVRGRIRRPYRGNGVGDNRQNQVIEFEPEKDENVELPRFASPSIQEIASFLVSKFFATSSSATHTSTDNEEVVNVKGPIVLEPRIVLSTSNGMERKEGDPSIAGVSSLVVEAILTADCSHHASDMISQTSRTNLPLLDRPLPFFVKQKSLPVIPFFANVIVSESRSAVEGVEVVKKTFIGSHQAVDMISQPSANPPLLDRSLPFFIKQKSLPFIPFFANVIVSESHSTGIEPMDNDHDTGVVVVVVEDDTTAKKTFDGGLLPTPMDAFPQKKAKKNNSFLMTWPTILIPDKAAKEALEYTLETFGTKFSTYLSTTISRSSSMSDVVARDYEDSSAATTPLTTTSTVPQKAIMEEEKEVKTTMMDSIVDSISTTLSSSLQLPSPSSTMGLSVRPRPPHSPPRFDLLPVSAESVMEEHEDENEESDEMTVSPSMVLAATTTTTATSRPIKPATTSTIVHSQQEKKSLLDLKEIDSVLMEAEWALKLAEAALLF